MGVTLGCRVSASASEVPTWLLTTHHVLRHARVFLYYARLRQLRRLSPQLDPSRRLSPVGGKGSGRYPQCTSVRLDWKLAFSNDSRLESRKCGIGFHFSDQWKTRILTLNLTYHTMTEHGCKFIKLVMRSQKMLCR